MEFGNRLRSEREKQGVSLEDVEQETKIRKLYIKAIEDEHFSVLPPKVYAVGFVKRYAKFLNLDENEIAEQFKAIAYNDSAPEEPEEPELSRPVVSNDKPGNTRFNIKNLLIAIAFILIAIWLGNMVVGYLATRGSEQKENYNKPKVVEHQTKKVKKVTPVSTSQAKVKITATQKCWVLVKVDGILKFQGTMEPSQQKDFTGKENVYISAGNAGGLTVKLNNKQIQALGKNGEVVEYELFKDGTVKKL